MFGIRMMSSRGDTLYEREYAYTPEVIPRHVADSVIQAALSNILRRPSPGSDELAAAFVKQVIIPAAYPPVSGAVLGDDGRLWIQLRDVRDVRRYIVLDQMGTPSGMIALPLNVVLRAADADHLWAVEIEESGVPSLVRYKID